MTKIKVFYHFIKKVSADFKCVILLVLNYLNVGSNPLI